MRFFLLLLVLAAVSAQELANVDIRVLFQNSSQIIIGRCVKPCANNCIPQFFNQIVLNGRLSFALADFRTFGCFIGLDQKPLRNHTITALHCLENTCLFPRTSVYYDLIWVPIALPLEGFLTQHNDFNPVEEFSIPLFAQAVAQGRQFHCLRIQSDRNITILAINGQQPSTPEPYPVFLDPHFSYFYSFSALSTVPTALILTVASPVNDMSVTLLTHGSFSVDQCREPPTTTTTTTTLTTTTTTTVPSMCHVNTVKVDGILYSLLDDAPINNSSKDCQNKDTFIKIPFNWMLAETNDTAFWNIAASYYWNTARLANPGAKKGSYWTRYDMGPYDAILPGSFRDNGYNYITSNELGYSVTLDCSSNIFIRILLQHKPCPAGQTVWENCFTNTHCSATTITTTTTTTTTDNVIRQLAAGFAHTCALHYSGKVSCWGRNREGQLGLGYVSQHELPQKILNLNNVVKLKAKAYSTCVLFLNKTVSCWGFDGYVNVSFAGTQNSPRQIPDLQNITDIAVGNCFLCVIDELSFASCYGCKKDVNTIFTIAVKNLPNVLSITAGDSHCCVLFANKTVACWGDNQLGQLGRGYESHGNCTIIDYGTTYSENCNNGYPQIDFALGLHNVTSIEAGRDHTCAVFSNKTVACWGNNFYGQLGLGHYYISMMDGYPTPKLLSNLGNVTSISAGMVQTCATHVNGRVSCWGGNLYTSNLIEEDYVPKAKDFRLREYPAIIPFIDYVSSITSGYEHTCLVYSPSSFSCFGWNGFGNLGVLPGDSEPWWVDCTVDANGISCTPWYNVTTISSTLTFSPFTSNLAGNLQELFHLLPNNSVVCYSDLQPCYEPQNVIDITAGNNHICVIFKTGLVACSDSFRNPVVNYPSLANVTIEVVAGNQASFALLKNGSVASWNRNFTGATLNNGELGIGVNSTSGHFSPTLIPRLDHVVAIASSAASSHTCVLFQNTSVACWGKNVNGQLGLGFTSAFSSTPLLIPNMSDVVALGTGYEHTCALFQNTSVACWGSNQFGQLGLGTFNNSPTPKLVPNLLNVRDIALGDSHTCVLFHNTLVACWGYNINGQLGLDNLISQTSPTYVPHLVGVVDIFSVYETTCVHYKDMSVACWGRLPSALGSEITVINNRISTTTRTTTTKTTSTSTKTTSTTAISTTSTLLLVFETDAECRINNVLDNGILYASLDDVNVNNRSNGCHGDNAWGIDTYIPIPNNWRLAVTNDVANWPIAGNNYWSTEFIANPGAALGFYFTKYTDITGSRGSLVSGTQYIVSDITKGLKVAYCNTRILIQHDPCPSGHTVSSTCTGDNHCGSTPWQN